MVQEVREDWRKRAIEVVNAVRAMLTVDDLAAIISDRFNLKTGLACGRSAELEVRSNECAAHGKEVVEDDVALACFLAYQEVILACRSLLCRSDSPQYVIIHEEGCTYQNGGKTVRVPRAYFVSRLGDHAALPWDLADRLYDAILDAWHDRKLSMDDDLCSLNHAGVRMVTIRHA